MEVELGKISITRKKNPTGVGHQFDVND